MSAALASTSALCGSSVVQVTRVSRASRQAVTVQARQVGGEKDPETVRYGQRLSANGYIAEDNSGRGNIFGTEPKQLYTSSPTSDKVARSGIGGLQGVGILAVIVGIVFLSAKGSVTYDGDVLDKVQAANANAESILAISTRVASQL